MSEKNITLQDALEMIAEALAEDLGDIQPDTELESLGGWDSMGGLMLMGEFDERFEITLEESQVRGFKLVSDILDVIKTQGLLIE